jgi:hypothetical protein
VAVDLTLVQTKQIRINIHKRKNTNTQYKQFKTRSIQLHILPKHLQNCKTPKHMEKSKTKNEVVTDGENFLSALLGDATVNDSKLKIPLSAVCPSVCVCPLMSTVPAGNSSEFIFRHAVLF